MAVCRKRILGFAVAALVFVMAAALIYEVFDIHDPKPFFTDPEYLLMMLSSMLIFCIGIPTLGRSLCCFWVFLSELLPRRIFCLFFSSTLHSGKFEIEHLLFSPPLSLTSLRI